MISIDVVTDGLKGKKRVDTKKPYWLYLLECRGNKWYAGIALNVQDRFETHVSGKGAKFTKANPPIRILAKGLYASKGDALRAEWQLKKLPKSRKLAFFQAIEKPKTAQLFLAN